MAEIYINWFKISSHVVSFNKKPILYKEFNNQPVVLQYKLQITTSFQNNSTRYLNEKKGEFSMCVCWMRTGYDY